MLLLLAGCNQPANQPQNQANNSDSTNGGITQPQTNTGTIDSPDQTNPVGEGKTAGQAENIGEQDVFSQFTNALGLYPEYKATYNFSSTTSGQTTGGTYTWYFKSSKQRTDMALQQVNSRTWILSDKLVTCSTSPGSEQESCYEFALNDSSSDQGLQTFKANDLTTNRSNYTVTSLPARTIAGQAAICYQIITTVQNIESTSEYCLSSRGILLYLNSTTQNNSWEMEATSVTNSVTDAEMTPPAAQRFEMPQYPEGP